VIPTDRNSRFTKCGAEKHTEEKQSRVSSGSPKWFRASRSAMKVAFGGLTRLNVLLHIDTALCCVTGLFRLRLRSTAHGNVHRAMLRRPASLVVASTEQRKIRHGAKTSTFTRQILERRLTNCGCQMIHHSQRSSQPEDALRSISKKSAVRLHPCRL
jgi:hypothetical protein